MYSDDVAKVFEIFGRFFIDWKQIDLLEIDIEYLIDKKMIYIES